MPVTLVRRRLRSSYSPTQMLCALRGEPGLCGLLGVWNDTLAIIGWRPLAYLDSDDDPFDAIGRIPTMEGAGSFGGGWIGALGYRLAGRLEALPPGPPRPIPTPEFTLAYYDRVLVHDGSGWWLEVLAESDDPGRPGREARSLEEKLAQAPTKSAIAFSCGDFAAVPNASGHEEAVARTLAHLAAGDIYQANVCRRFEACFTGDPLDAFCTAVERLTPKYAAFLRTQQGAIVSLSPELFLRRRGRRIRTSPIKGTAALDSDVEDLVASAKNRAENVMIVDLMRNDLGRVCVPGSIRVEDIARAEQHTGVWHLVSHVVGELAPDHDDASLLRATFPPGSVTGAPKVRAMEIIGELETTSRETYTGAIGYASPRAGLELNVAIRTFEFTEDQVWLGVGGGVVIDSTPAGELAETLVKARPLIEAIGAKIEPAESPRLIIAESSQGKPGLRLSRPASPLPPVDRGHGVFTTILVRDGTPVDLGPHLKRLAASTDACFACTLPHDLFERVVSTSAPLRGLHRLRVTVVPYGDSLVAANLVTSGLAVQPTQPLRLTPKVLPGGLGPHKYADRRRLDALEAGGLSGATTLLVDEDGAVLETGTGNLFVVTEAAVLTPALDGRLLPGVTRQRAIDELSAAGIPVIQGRITCDDLENAHEVFVTGALTQVRPVNCIDQVGAWEPGLTTQWLAGRLSGRLTVPEPPGHPAPPRHVRLLIIDNYDSFVYNLDQLVRELGAHTDVVRNDATTLQEVVAAFEQDRFDGIIVSPGPGSPADAGISTAVVQRLGPMVPILGVCLGHQCIAAAYGARVVRADEILHGKQSLVHHDGAGVFRGLDAPLLAARYHSLVVSESSLPAELHVTARTANHVVMGIRHREHPLEGLQIHPESILTLWGRHLLDNFLAMCAADPTSHLRGERTGSSQHPEGTLATTTSSRIGH